MSRRPISRPVRTIIIGAVFALVIGACSGDAGGEVTTTAAPETTTTTTTTVGDAESQDPIIVGHLTAHTGPFADVGPLLDGATAFAISLINEAPPLGRKFVQIDQDLGTIGEAQATRLLIERDNTDILWGVAHEYLSYRDWILQRIADFGGPIMPSVHGGAIPVEYGGTGEEPMFRGAPMDSGQAVAAVLQAQEAGAETIAILATEIEGSQLQKDTAVRVAGELGLDVVATIDVQPEQASYRAALSAIVAADPDALLMFTQAEDGGTIVKQAAEAGLSLVIIGTQEWMGIAFPEVATASALEQHQEVWIAAYTYADSPAWDFFESKWNDSEFAELAAAENSYALQFYDLLNVTALAIESAGTLEANAWADHVRKVAMGPGKVVYSYAEGVEALRNGEEIDYSGVTGEYDYTETAVVSGLYGIFEWTSDTELLRVNVIDDRIILELDS